MTRTSNKQSNANNLRDSAVDHDLEHASKRQRMSQNASSSLQHSSSPPLCHTPETGSMPPNNSPSRGRKRFFADLENTEQACQKGQLTTCGLNVQGLKGDEEGNIEFKVMKDKDHIISINLLVSDSTEYPAYHTFYPFSLDAAVPSNLLEILETTASESSRPIQQAIEKLLHAISTVLNQNGATGSSQLHEGHEDEDDGNEDYDLYDDDDFGLAMTESLQLPRLRRDFMEIAAANYRPGLLRLDTNNFSISVSIPVIALASDISPRALMAWDRRLLSHHQYLTLLIYGFRGTYPPLTSDGTYTLDAERKGSSLQFRVGLTPKYKPGKKNAAEVGRIFGLVTVPPDTVEEKPSIGKSAHSDGEEYRWTSFDDEEKPEDKAEEELEDEGRFEKISLSSSLDSLLDHTLVRLVRIRKRFALGWAGAEVLLAASESLQKTTEEVFQAKKNDILAADKEELQLSQTYRLPQDPFTGQDRAADINLPLVAFCYLIRRLALCTRYCLVCYNKINTNFESLKPYVCDSKLCTYQYYSLNRGPSLEYEIMTNPATVDLLVSVTYTAACEGSLDEPLPIGMGIRVPPPPVTETADGVFKIDSDGLCDFDDLNINQMRTAVAYSINTLPRISDIKKHLERPNKVGRVKPTLRNMSADIPTSAWSILRWCVASCTAHLEELTAEEDLVQNIDSSYKQFHFSVGSPDAEAKFRAAVAEVQKTDEGARTYPSLYAFHGSPLKNWHSIIRHGLWYKTIANGRAYGNGVYFSKEGSVSMVSYAHGSPNIWPNSAVGPSSCTVIAEIVNSPSKFVSTNPFFVVADTTWIICRYLLVKTSASLPPLDSTADAGTREGSSQPEVPKIPFVRLDPLHPLTMTRRSWYGQSGTAGGPLHIKIPDPSYKLEKLLSSCQEEYRVDEYDEEDSLLLGAKHTEDSKQAEAIEVDDSPPPDAIDDWKHDPEWLESALAHLTPPPEESTPSAVVALQRELLAMVNEQNKAKSLKHLGWYMPPSDNLFQWAIELHSFDPQLLLAEDMAARGVNSIVLEIRFPPTYPHSPPFFRVIKPRFLPFMQGGGGHITAGGSICMDLLTADGWLPSYSISAVLLQIRLAISSVDPKPARLAYNWDSFYGAHDALEGYKRAAAIHKWRVPEGIDKLAG